MYETLMGSTAYGVFTDDYGRVIFGFCVPPKEDVFPHLSGEIPGFDNPRERFEQFQEAHIDDPSANNGDGCEWDFAIYSVVKYISLCLECNPNIIDSLFTPQDCVLHITKVGSMVRERRRLFFTKAAGLGLRVMRTPRCAKCVQKERPVSERF
ncbi:nucleotidyltransferase domain-containing protein [Fuerstiella marisgermanici]|nr:nucleotidyltransferase domain-containing protein [Fuerstiella marisgermanici]